MIKPRPLIRPPTEGTFDKKKEKTGGRQKGTKNQTTIFKEAVLQEAEDILMANVTKIVKKTIDLAEEGDTTCLKILWDRIIPTKRHEDSEGREDKLNISISIEGMETKTATISEQRNVVDGDFKEVN
jgi:hypothetical protein